MIDVNVNENVVNIYLTRDIIIQHNYPEKIEVILGSYIFIIVVTNKF